MSEDIEMRDQPADESDAVEALVQLSQDPVVLEGNRPNTTAPNNHEVVSQPQPQPQPQSLTGSNGDVEMEVDIDQSQGQLQAFLYRQQRLAGIPPDQMISMTGERGAPTHGGDPGPVNRPENPSVVQFSSAGTVLAPFIPPAMFNGVMQPLPFENEAPHLNNQVPTIEQSASQALALNEEMYGPEGRSDRDRGTQRGITVGDSLDNYIDWSSVLTENTGRTLPGDDSIATFNKFTGSCNF